MSKYFVWIKGFQHPEAQIWIGDDHTDGNGKAKPFIFKRKLEPFEENLNLDSLAEVYENEQHQKS